LADHQISLLARSRREGGGNFPFALRGPFFVFLWWGVRPPMDGFEFRPAVVFKKMPVIVFAERWSWLTVCLSFLPVHEFLLATSMTSSYLSLGSFAA